MSNKKWLFKQSPVENIESLQKALGIREIFCKLLVQNSIKSFIEAKNFFRPDLEQLHDPFLMKDMNKAIERIESAINKNERILLYGDYDVDGTTSVALMHLFLRKFYDNLDYYIPDRYKEGYGISEQGVDFAAQNDVKLIIAMDCGIKAIEQVALAKSKGIDFVICDHHLPAEKLPEAIAVLDPKRSDCPYPYKELSGCGITFKLIQGINQKHKQDIQELKPYLDLVAISIACDIVPITGENRILTYYGLEEINAIPRIGIKALIKAAKRFPPLSISDIVFGIGPMINSAGRLADARQAVRLLTCEKQAVAKAYADILFYQNNQRKVFDQKITAEAIEAFQSQEEWENLNSIVLYQSDWHKGVIGIAAARVAEHFNRPTIILTESEGKMVGSARSIAGIDIFKALTACKSILDNFGGHKYAAGMTLNTNKLNDLQAKFEASIKKQTSENELQPVIEISSVLLFKDINNKFWNILKQFAPFGPHNKNPIFLSQSVEIVDLTILKGKHLKVKLKQAGNFEQAGIGFGLGSDCLFKKGDLVDICYTIGENAWWGKRSLQLLIKDIKVSDTQEK